MPAESAMEETQDTPHVETATLNKLRQSLWHYPEACPALHTPRLFVMDVRNKMVRQPLRKPAATAYSWLLDGKGQQDEKVVSLLDEICPGPRTVENIHEQIVQYENYKNRAGLRTFIHLCQSFLTYSDRSVSFIFLILIARTKSLSRVPTVP